MREREIRMVSKFMSLVLRHEPEKIGITLDDAGWVSVETFLEAMNRFHVPLDMEGLLEIVENNNKKRFTIENGKIRANQGHTVEVNLGLPEQEPPELLYHGTVDKFLSSILEKGLLKGERHDVHLSADRETAVKVGNRRGRAVVLVIQAKQMHQDGYKFYLSANGVWLTDAVPPRYINLYLISMPRARADKRGMNEWPSRYMMKTLVQILRIKIRGSNRTNRLRKKRKKHLEDIRQWWYNLRVNNKMNSLAGDSRTNNLTDVKALMAKAKTIMVIGLSGLRNGYITSIAFVPLDKFSEVSEEAIANLVHRETRRIFFLPLHDEPPTTDLVTTVMILNENATIFVVLQYLYDQKCFIDNPNRPSLEEIEL